MFKSKIRTRERRIFGNRQRGRRRHFGLWAIASVALFLVVLELLMRIFMDLSGGDSQLAQVNPASEITQTYRLNFVADEAKTNKSGSNILTAKPDVSLGYQLLGNQKNEFWQINEQGFRDRDGVPLVKPKDEVRIFILGGSTAFGYGNPSNAATISEQLEKRLQQRLEQQKTAPKLYKPDVLPGDGAEKQKALAKPAKIKSGNYRVINAAVPGYASGNELAQLALQILEYKPDLIMIMDGYEDLMLPSQEKAVQVPGLKNYFSDQQPGFAGYMSQLIKPIKDKSYLVKVVENRWLNTGEAGNQADFLLKEKTPKLIQHLPRDKNELQARAKRYAEHQKQILSLSAAAQVPLIVALQPEITGRSPSQLTSVEGEIATELGRTYIKQVQADYPILIQGTQQLAKSFPFNMKAVDLYKLTDQYPSPSFIDPIHLNPEANEKVAEQLYYAVSDFSKMQVIPVEPPEKQPVYPKSIYQRGY